MCSAASVDSYLLCIIYTHTHHPSLFLFNQTPPTDIYTLSLHDALPICPPHVGDAPRSAAATSRPSGARSRARADRKSTRLNSSHVEISYAVFCLKKKKENRAGCVVRLINDGWKSKRAGVSDGSGMKETL